MGALALCLSLTGYSAMARAEEPSQFMDKVGKDVVAILQNGSLSSQEKTSKLVDLLNKASDLDLVARLVLGRSWRDATPEQQAEYTKLFRALLAKTIADRLSAYGGETYEIVGSEKAGDHDTMVSTRIMRPSGQPPVNVQWRIRDDKGELKIIDIVAEGISLIVTQRSEATDVVSKQGIDGLLAEMRRRTSQPGNG